MMANPCPSCGGPVPEDTVWIYQQKFYCTEKCAARARTKGLV